MIRKQVHQNELKIEQLGRQSLYSNLKTQIRPLIFRWGEIFVDSQVGQQHLPAYGKNVTTMFHPFLSWKPSSICLATAASCAFSKTTSAVLTFSPAALGFVDGLTCAV
jgi:hypothetical protein